nr:LPS export ABC transporter permease LptF [Anaerobiospirillum sp. NML120449]
MRFDTEDQTVLLDKYIFKELLKSQLVVLLVLVTIFAGQSIVKLMTEAVVGGLPPRLIAMFLLYSLPEFLVYLLPLTLYVAIIITLGRICTDSEMVVMRAVGYSPGRIMMVAMIMGLVSAVAVGYISMVLTWKAADARYAMEQQAANDPEFLPIDSGRFVSFGQFNIYVEKLVTRDSQTRDVNNIYVIDDHSITVASEGHLFVDEDGVRWLELSDGRRYEYPADGSFRKAEFSSFRAPVSANITDETRQGRSIARTSTMDLIARVDGVREKVEVQWRIIPILTTLVMCMVAVPLSMVNPRHGRFARLMPAILIYVAYYLFLMSTRNFVMTGVLPLYPGMYAVPVLFLMLVAIPLNLPKAHIKHIRHNRRKNMAAALAEVAATSRKADAGFWGDNGKESSDHAGSAAGRSENSNPDRKDGH